LEVGDAPPNGNSWIRPWPPEDTFL